MKNRSRMSRFLITAGVMAGMVVPLGLATIAVSSPAYAKKAKKIKCKTLNLNATSGAVTIGKCSDPKNTGKSGTIPNAAVLASGGTAVISWANGGTSTVVFAAPVVSSPGACPAGDTEFSVSGSVTAGTPPSVNSIPVGDTVTGNACLTPAGALSWLPPGLVFV